jgi:hypothetical protein
MTEAEWLAATDPTPMLDFIPGKITERKLRLFLCAMCRRHWHTVTKEVFRDVIEVAERYANGLATEVVREQACRATECKVQQRSHYSLQPYLRAFHDAVSSDIDFSDPDWQARSLRWFRSKPEVSQSLLARDIFGPLLFRTINFNSSWLSSKAVSLAQQMYVSRDFTAMPILADALQDAGCDNDEILNHCRQPGEHFRGCWVVDLLTGRT